MQTKGGTLDVTDLLWNLQDKVDTVWVSYKQKVSSGRADGTLLPSNTHKNPLVKTAPPYTIAA
jgi:hypothetical protein